MVLVYYWTFNVFFYFLHWFCSVYLRIFQWNAFWNVSITIDCWMRYFIHSVWVKHISIAPGENSQHWKQLSHCDPIDNGNCVNRIHGQINYITKQCLLRALIERHCILDWITATQHSRITLDKLKFLGKCYTKIRLNLYYYFHIKKLLVPKNVVRINGGLSLINLACLEKQSFALLCGKVPFYW